MRHDVFNNKVYLATSLIPGAGYGVFAKRNLVQGELIEIAPFFEVTQEVVTIMPSRLRDYAFKSHLHPDKAIIILGYGSIYNHQPRPNVKYVPYPGDPRRFIGFYALRDIPSDSELYVHYGRDPITMKRSKAILI